jgi:hypothetical protein
MFLIIAKTARKLHKILNQIKVGIVFTVEDQINAMLEVSAKIYSHQN